MRFSRHIFEIDDDTSENVYIHIIQFPKLLLLTIAGITNSHGLLFLQPSVVDILKSQMTEVAKAKKQGGVNIDGNPFAATNFLRQFRDKDSRELKQLSAAQFMKVWEHYDEDGKDISIKTSSL